MRSKSILRYSLILTLIALLAGVGQGRTAPLDQDVVLNITYPAEGSTLSGEVVIQGTATHPNFNSYGLLYANVPQVTADTPWRLDDAIVWDVATMVVNGQLGVWDTTQVPNGQYVLALVVYEVGNDTPIPLFVNNLTVLNEEATPTPEPTEESTPTSEAQPTDDNTVPGDGTAVPTIDQPPTATPRPTPTPGPEQIFTDEGDDGTGKSPAEILSIDSIKETFRAGVQLAVMFYVFGGMYVIMKAAIRYYLRQQQRQKITRE